MYSLFLFRKISGKLEFAGIIRVCPHLEEFSENTTQPAEGLLVLYSGEDLNFDQKPMFISRNALLGPVICLLLRQHVPVESQCSHSMFMQNIINVPRESYICFKWMTSWKPLFSVLNTHFMLYKIQKFSVNVSICIQ